MDACTEILTCARQSGADVAGIVSVTQLQAHGALPPGWSDAQPHPVGAVLVLGLAHPAHQPELDWWGGPGGTEGNRRLMRLVASVASWTREHLRAEGWDVPYGLDRGGIRLKDAAVLAGLGVIGHNNLLLTEVHGPRIRLRAMAVSIPVGAAATHPQRRPTPCAGCDAPCHAACPQDAFASGHYDRERCNRQMAWDEAHPVAGASSPAGSRTPRRIAYCRACELACPAGSPAAPAASAGDGTARTR